ncbi:hypothetical protein BT96DRAFT_947492 [Gymnopus androsaceus JB14]|uniref:Uncharacterized protein n=1 Tax=Gymnopus androsaceus JB14 TaxID=1447944 RepID=A0A6A4GT14_9AGAR|nr:hypothetical protein BT96DRAFT_947492 [Gymnopus androsaceus JB14]
MYYFPPMHIHVVRPERRAITSNLYYFTWISQEDYTERGKKSRGIRTASWGIPLDNSQIKNLLVARNYPVWLMRVEHELDMEWISELRRKLGTSDLGFVNNDGGGGGSEMIQNAWHYHAREIKMTAKELLIGVVFDVAGVGGWLIGLAIGQEKG